MISMNRIVSQLGLMSMLAAMPIAAVDDISGTIHHLSTPRRVGQDNANFFQDAFSQQLSEEMTGGGSKKIYLENLYKNAHDLLPLATTRNGLWLNEQGKILYRVPKGVHCSCLYLFDVNRGKHLEIARYHNYKFDTLPPYRLNNKGDILYFEHSSLEDWNIYVKPLHNRRGLLLDAKKFENIPNPNPIAFSEFLRHFGSEMEHSYFARVDFNDLGQALFSYGNPSHQAWLIDPNYATTQLWDLPYHVVGLNQSGDVFLHSAGGLGAVYHSSKRKLFPFDAPRTTHDHVIVNRLRSAVLPADPSADPLMGWPHLYLAGDHVKALESFEGHKVTLQGLNDRAQAVGFGTLSLMGPTYKPNYMKGVFYNTADGVKELEDFGNRRSAVFGINNAGIMAGFAEGIDGKIHAFLKTPKKLVNLGILFPDNSMALDINDQGWVVGAHKDEKGLLQGFLYHSEKGVVNIAQGLNEHYTTSFNIPIGFNQKGQVLGILFFIKEEKVYRLPFVFNPETGRAVHLPHYAPEEVKL